MAASGGEAGAGVGAGGEVSLADYFNWADEHVKDSALDVALRPFYLLPSPSQEKERVLGQLRVCPGARGVALEPGQTTYLIAAGWWRHWSCYVGLTAADVKDVPPELGVSVATAPVAATAATGQEVRVGGTNGGRPSAVVTAAATVAGGGSDRAAVVSAVSSSATKPSGRPHEVDNSNLQGAAEWELAPGLGLGTDYVLVPKEVWDMVVDWYGGGPAFARGVVRIPYLELSPPSMP
ncbi:unnamed protein product, partial [Discosporangium mesarthrocarpum]